jgi:hypothetical protein
VINWALLILVRPTNSRGPLIWEPQCGRTARTSQGQPCAWRESSSTRRSAEEARRAQRAPPLRALARGLVNTSTCSSPQQDAAPSVKLSTLVARASPSPQSWRYWSRSSTRMSECEVVCRRSVHRLWLPAWEREVDVIDAVAQEPRNGRLLVLAASPRRAPARPRRVRAGRRRKHAAEHARAVSSRVHVLATSPQGRHREIEIRFDFFVLPPLCFINYKLVLTIFIFSHSNPQNFYPLTLLSLKKLCCGGNYMADCHNWSTLLFVLHLIYSLH